MDINFPSTNQIKSALYYPACFADIQPIIKFSKYVQTFIYVDIKSNSDYLEKEISDTNEMLGYECMKVLTLKRYENQSFFSDNRQIEKNIFLEKLHEKIASDNSILSSIYETLGRSPEDFNVYNLDVIEIEYEYEKESKSRNINLYYFTAEGYMTYFYLYNLGNIAPKILCTVNSGIIYDAFEFTMKSLMRYFDEYPEIIITTGTFDSEFLVGRIKDWKSYGYPFEHKEYHTVFVYSMNWNFYKAILENMK